MAGERPLVCLWVAPEIHRGPVDRIRLQGAHLLPSTQINGREANERALFITPLLVYLGDYSQKTIQIVNLLSVLTILRTLKYFDVRKDDRSLPGELAGRACRKPSWTKPPALRNTSRAVSQ